MKKVLIAVMAIVLAVGLMGSALAYFTDTQVSNANVFSGGNIHLALSNDGTNFYNTPPGNVVIGTATNMAPGHAYGPYTAYFKNTGTIGGLVTAYVSYDTNNKGEEFAKLLIVDQAYSNVSGAVNVAPSWAQQIADNSGGWPNAVTAGYIVEDSSSATGYYPTIAGLRTFALTFTTGYPGGTGVTLDPNAVQWDQMYIKLDSSADNTYEDFGITIAVTATLTSN
jgi:predicted ribosomally synthesized peptide with SipW-like signal peptide